MRTQIRFDILVRHFLWVLIGGTERARRTKDCLVGKHSVQSIFEATRNGHVHERLESLRRPVVVRVAVGDSQRSDATGIERGEYLRDAAATVVADEIDLLDM